MVYLEHCTISISFDNFTNFPRYPFDSEEAKLLNKQIFETMYYGAMEASCELAEKEGPYETYVGCPVSKGVSWWTSTLIM